jgi:hypothetical protein
VVTVTDSLITVWFGRGWGKPRKCKLLSGRGRSTGVRKEGAGVQGHEAAPILLIGKFPPENKPEIDTESGPF